eukprot:11106583-Karenia_brevis.AAC.1
MVPGMQDRVALWSSADQIAGVLRKLGPHVACTWLKTCMGGWITTKRSRAAHNAFGHFACR